MINTIRNSLLVVLLVTLAGCGFHPRGQLEVPDNLRTVSINGVSEFSEFAVALKRTLVNNGINVVDDGHAAQAVIKLSGLVFDSRVLSVSSVSGKVREYELQYSVQMTVVDNQGKTLLSPHRLRQVRDYVFNENDVLGKSSEEALLRKEMEADLIQQVLHRLQARQQG